MKLTRFNSTKEVNISPTPYIIDWDKKVSGPQKLVKDSIRPYWGTHVMLEEFRIPGCLLRVDLMNLTRYVAIEVSPESTHGEFNKFMHGSREGYKNVMRRDMQKIDWLEDNGFTVVEVDDEALELFEAGQVKEWFKDYYDITL